MTPLRQRMLDALVLRGMALRTQESYIDAVAQLARRYAGGAGGEPAGTRGRAGLHAPRGRHRDRLLPALQGRALAVPARVVRWSVGAGDVCNTGLPGTAVVRAILLGFVGKLLHPPCRPGQCCAGCATNAPRACHQVFSAMPHARFPHDGIDTRPLAREPPTTSLPPRTAETYNAHSAVTSAVQFNKVCPTPCSAVPSFTVASASDKRCSFAVIYTRK